MKSYLHRIQVLLSCMLLLSGQIAWSATITLNPTADTDSQSDVSAGKNPTLNASQWCHLFIKFSLSSISGNVSSAKLRIYQPNAQSSYTLNINTTSTDTWVEGGTKPTTGSLITSKSAGPAGYVEIDITTHVQSKMAGNKIVSLSLTTNIGTWTSFNSREASSNKPELVIITSDVPVTGVTVSPTSLSLTAGQTGQLTATVQPGDATNKNVSWSSSNPSVATVNSSGLVTAVAAGSATITVTTQDGGKTATCAVTITAAGLPSPWQTQNIGSVGQTGSASYSNGSFTVGGSGADIWGTADGFRFVYQSLNGDGEIKARVVSQTNTDGWAKAGVMIRESLTAGSKHAFTCVTPSNGLAFQRRASTDGTSDHTSGGSGTAPVWVRLVRSGNTFTSYRSSDGSSWTQVGSATISMASQVYVGLAVTSHNNSATSTAVFENVTVGSGSSTIPVTGVTISPTALSLTAGQTGQLTATVQPADATNKNVSWSSSNTSVATVNSSGLVTAVAAGSASITVTTQDGGKTATCAVTVTSSQTLTKYEAENATLSGVSIASSVSGYSGTGYMDGGSFDQTGDKIIFNVNVSSAGQYPLIIRFQNTCGICEKYQNVRINGGSDVYTRFNGTTGGWEDLNYGNVSLNTGNNTIEINKSWGWTHIDYITIGTSGGGSTVPVTGVTVSPISLSLTAGQTGQLTATVQPDNATNKNVSWSSSNTSVATVNSSGLVTAVAAGSATITVTTQDGGKTATCAVTVTSSGGGTQGTMTAGTNFWHIGWEGWQNTFRSGVNWSTTTDPWNPTLISELQAAKIKCLRFMDWNQTNHGCIQNWSQRIPKTANHYNVDNKLPLFVDNYNSQTNTHNLVWNGSYDYGVAYEWQIDLCNRVGADLWINIPVTATQDFQYQLATLIKNQLRSDLKVYVEWGNEIWNWGFASTVYADQQAKTLGLQNVDVGAYCDPWRKYCVYASVRAFEQFERVFGTNSPRLVKVLAGQVGYHWPGYNYNHMVAGDLACLNNATINPNHITINAYAMAPYMGGQSMTEQRNALTGVRDGMQWAKNSLAGTNISLICYEGGADNYPDGSLTLTRDPQQEQIYVDYLNLLDDYCTGVFNQYTFYGGCWGLKYAAGESADINPKWRGWLSYWSLKSGTVQSEEQETASIDPQSTVQGGFQLAFVYPNPSVNGTLNLSFTEMISNSDVLIRIIDATGKVVYQNLISKPSRMYSISTQNFDKGLYFISIDAIGRKTVLKVMVN